MAGITTEPETVASLPLADYFYIAGIDTSQIYERPSSTSLFATPPAVETTIDELSALVTNGASTLSPPGSPNVESRSRPSSRYSFDARKSMASFITPGESTSNPTSNRSSSITLKALQPGTAGLLSEEDFEQALRKFASERDTAIEEIHVSAGTIPRSSSRSTRPRPRTIRLQESEEVVSPGLKSGVGSLRRRISTMNTGRRAQSATRPTSVRTTKRMSGYNAVIPTPEPFKVDPAMHPLKRRYEPALLDCYPPKSIVSDQTNGRCTFPDYVPMFAFPNDVNVVSSDERPRSTWHGFTMTTSNGSRLHSVCATIWVPLCQEAAADLERQCETWRQRNMSSEERELASSLGERLANERAHLSQLLSQLPEVASGSSARDDLEEEISAVEERISMMADLLRPVRHAAASKIEGLTQNETGFWVPRVYGLLGRDGNMCSFWKEWLKAILVPMSDGAVLNVPASSPRVGMWQPLERYVVNICMEAPSPLASMTQVEVAIRELRLYARKEAINELPGSRNVDLYPLFRALSISNIISLFECIVAEGRVILLSSYASMLHLVSAALQNLLYPMTLSGIFIPLLPCRLLQALEAPCPYIIGVERRFDNIIFPTDDFILVDLDNDTIEVTTEPPQLPRQIRRKLTASLQVAAQHHNRFGTPIGPPIYAMETFPNNLFSSENSHIYDSRATRSNLASNVTMPSNSFSDIQISQSSPPIFNAFLSAKIDSTMSERKVSGRPGTSSTTKASSQSSTHAPPSPAISASIFDSFPNTPLSRNDSAFAFGSILREKKSGNFETAARRSSFTLDRMIPLRRSTVGLSHSHSPSVSTSNFGSSVGGPGYASSIYAPSTLAASTIMPTAFIQTVKDTETNKWSEGHCMVKQAARQGGGSILCSICNEKCGDEYHQCTGKISLLNTYGAHDLLT